MPRGCPTPKASGTGVIWTIGHSNRELSEFLDLLASASVATLADVRRFPGSRRHPHFGREALESALAESGIAYRHVPDLGGRRGRSRPGSPNTAWRVEAFNAYADHMETPEFVRSLEVVTSDALAGPTALMCAEALPWQCHRRLIADLLTARGWDVRDIFGPGKTHPHMLTPFAHFENGRLTYLRSRFSSRRVWMMHEGTRRPRPRATDRHRTKRSGQLGRSRR